MEKLSLSFESYAFSLLILPEIRVNDGYFTIEDGNPARANIKQALGYLKGWRWRWNSQHLRYKVNDRMLDTGGDLHCYEVMKVPVKVSKLPDKTLMSCIVFTSAQDGDPCIVNDKREVSTRDINVD
ncbi:hypothetical protein Tco_0610922 [Tanacetum coccineum]